MSNQITKFSWDASFDQHVDDNFYISLTINNEAKKYPILTMLPPLKWAGYIIKELTPHHRLRCFNNVRCYTGDQHEIYICPELDYTIYRIIFTGGMDYWMKVVSRSFARNAVALDFDCDITNYTAADIVENCYEEKNYNTIIAPNVIWTRLHNHKPRVMLSATPLADKPLDIMSLLDLLSDEKYPKM